MTTQLIELQTGGDHLTRHTDARFMLCDAYASGQKGGVENAKSRIRRVCAVVFLYG